MRTRCCRLLVAGAVIALVMPSALAADCEQPSVGFVPLNDLGSGLYLDEFEGGLYPNGSNMPPSPHFSEGVTRARALMPLDPQGEFSATGSIVLLSIGMSNTTQKCSDFEIDGTHPGTAAEEKAGHMLLEFVLHSPFARPWFTENPADLNDDGIVSFTDMLILLSSWGPCPPPPEACEADIDENGFVGLGDLLILLSSWG